MTAKEKTVHTETQTEAIWRFVNPCAPNDTRYLPCPRLNANLVETAIRSFRGKIVMECWFASGLVGFDTFFEFWFSGEGSKIIDKLGLSNPYINDRYDILILKKDCSFFLAFNVPVKKGQKITATMCETFIAFARAIGDPNYLRCLPAPHISLVTMIKDNKWVPYGQYLWEHEFGDKIIPTSAKAQKGTRQ